jgi:hypothetical protein
MSERTEFELVSYLKALVDCSLELGTTETHVLAGALYLSNETVNTYWKRIKETLGIQKRHEAVRLAREGRIMSRGCSQSRLSLPDQPIEKSPRICFIVRKKITLSRVPKLEDWELLKKHIGKH